MCLSLFSTPSVLPSATLYTEGSSNTNLQREGARRKRGTPPPGESDRFQRWVDGRLPNDKFFGRKPNPAQKTAHTVIEDLSKPKNKPKGNMPTLESVNAEINSLCQRYGENMHKLRQRTDPYIQALFRELDRLQRNRG
jgi:hypothetical protein